MISTELLAIVLASILAATTCIVVYINVHKEVDMAKAGYVEKIICIGNPDNSYSRVITRVWVKADGTPIVEQK